MENGYTTLAEVRKELKNAKKIPTIAEKVGISTEYLTYDIFKRSLKLVGGTATHASTYDDSTKNQKGIPEKQIKTPGPPSI